MKVQVVLFFFLNRSSVVIIAIHTIKVRYPISLILPNWYCRLFQLGDKIILCLKIYIDAYTYLPVVLNALLIEYRVQV